MNNGTAANAVTIGAFFTVLDSCMISGKNGSIDWDKSSDGNTRPDTGRCQESTDRCHQYAHSTQGPDCEDLTVLHRPPRHGRDIDQRTSGEF